MKNKNIEFKNWTIIHPLLQKIYYIPKTIMSTDEFWAIDNKLYNLKEKLNNEPNIKETEDFFCSDKLLTMGELNDRISPSSLIIEGKNTYARKYPYEYRYIKNVPETQDEINERKEKATLEILKMFFELDKKYCNN